MKVKITNRSEKGLVKLGREEASVQLSFFTPVSALAEML